MNNGTVGNLTGVFSFSDADGDIITINQTKWYNSSIEVTSLANLSTIESGNTAGGETWKFSVSGYDGNNWSAWSNSSNLIIVNNTGGEKLTFHATAGTCLVRGMTTSLDTMESLGVYMFVSDGALWNLIGGGSLPNEGLTAS